jgi:hypothetical protein
LAMRAFSAKVWESFSSSTGCCCCSCLAGAGEAAAGAKGFAAAGWLEVEKGLPEEAENGFAFWFDFEGCTPKRDSPMLVCGFGLGASSAGGAGVLAWDLVEVDFSWSTFEIRVVLMPRTEPSFLRQALFLHPNR